MKVLVTGATGFIGSHLVLRLLDAGHSVAILKRETSGLKRLDSVKDNLFIFSCDTYSDICAGLRQFRPDVVAHLAVLYCNPHTPGTIAAMLASNITFGTCVLEAMAENKIRYFLNIGTRWQHIDNEEYKPSNLYTATKEAFKDILYYYENKGLEHKTIELGDTFGEGDSRKRILDLLITSCRENKALDLTPGGQTLDLASVDDICMYITTKVTDPGFFDNQTVSISGTVISVRDLGAMVEKHFKRQGLFRWGAKPYRENEVMCQPIFYPKIQLNVGALEEYIAKIATEVR
jgi:nucleoside-diphosphate-sugar epimerase